MENYIKTGGQDVHCSLSIDCWYMYVSYPSQVAIIRKILLIWVLCCWYVWNRPAKSGVVKYWIGTREAFTRGSWMCFRANAHWLTVSLTTIVVSGKSGGGESKEAEAEAMYTVPRYTMALLCCCWPALRQQRAARVACIELSTSSSTRSSESAAMATVHERGGGQTLNSCVRSQRE